MSDYTIFISGRRHGTSTPAATRLETAESAVVDRDVAPGQRRFSHGGGDGPHADTLSQTIAAGEKLFLTGADGFTMAKIEALESSAEEVRFSVEPIEDSTVDGVQRRYVLSASVPLRAPVTLYDRNHPDDWFLGEIWLETLIQPAMLWDLSRFTRDEAGATWAPLRTRANPHNHAVAALISPWETHTFAALHARAP